ncbi:MAG: CHAT domain-containing protein [Candidatus Krumholzibacteriia bacterium]
MSAFRHLFPHSAARHRRGSAPACPQVGVLVVAAFCGTVAAAAPPTSMRESVPPAALVGHIDSLYAAGARDSAAALVSQWLPPARAARDTALLTDLLIRRGAPLVSFGAPVAAEPPLREALVLAEARADSHRACVALRWLAVAVAGCGRDQEAYALSIRQRDLAQRLGEPRLEAWARLWLGWHAQGEGLVQESLDQHAAARRLFRLAGDPRGEAWATNGLGIAQSSTGDHAAAQRSFRLAGALAESTGYTMVEAWAVNNLAGLEYSLGDPGAALASFQRALDLQERLGHQAEMVPPLLNVALCELDLARFAAAESTLSRARNICLENGHDDLLFTAMVKTAAMHARRGEFDRAVTTYRRALASPVAPRVSDRAQAEIGLARLLADRDSSAAALDLLATCAQRLGDDVSGGLVFEIAVQRGEILLRDGRPAAALAVLLPVRDDDRARDLNGVRMRALAAAGRCWLELGRPDSARTALEEAADHWERSRGLPLDPHWREQRGAAGWSIHIALANLLLTEDEHPAGERVRAAFDRLQAFKARTLLERMHGPGHESSPGLDVRNGAQEATLARVQSLLQPGELLLDLYLGPELSLLFAVGPDTQEVRRLPPEAEVAADLAFLQELLLLPLAGPPTASDEAALVAVLDRTAEDLFGGVTPLVRDARHVILAPDGAANLLPLAALPLRATGTTAAAEATSHWSTVPSASVFCILREAAAEDDRRTMSLPPRVLAVAGAATDDEPDIAGTRHEVAVLGRRYHGVTVGDPASISRTEVGPLSGWDVLHFATHVRLRDRAPWQAALVLPDGADAGGGRGATELPAAAIAATRLDPILTVLAGCESASGHVLPGEGVLGLTSAFLSAGSRAVIAALWPVDDATTSDLVGHLYAGLAEGMTAAEALRRAQFLVRAHPSTRHPFYWAGFVLVGDGEVRVPLQRRVAVAGSGARAGAALLAVGAAVLLLVSLRRRGPPVTRATATRLYP